MTWYFTAISFLLCHHLHLHPPEMYVNKCKAKLKCYCPLINQESKIIYWRSQKLWHRKCQTEQTTKTELKLTWEGEEVQAETLRWGDAQVRRMRWWNRRATKELMGWAHEVDARQAYIQVLRGRHLKAGRPRPHNVHTHTHAHTHTHTHSITQFIHVIPIVR